LLLIGIASYLPNAEVIQVGIGQINDSYVSINAFMLK